MSAINKSVNSDIDTNEKSSFNNNISSDSATFEFIERNQIIPNDNFNAATNKTKEEKQRLNEELLVMESANSGSSDVSSWEKIEIADVEKEELEACKNFLINEKSYNSDNSSIKAPTRPSTSSKPCFIDASSLLDDEYEVPNSFSQNSLLFGFKDDESSLNRQIMDNFQIDSPKPNCDNIRDQYSALPSYNNIPKNFRSPINVRELQQQQQPSYSESFLDQERQGHIIFHNVPPPSLQNRIDDYSSDLSFPSEYSSSSTCGTSETFNNNLLFENTSGYSGSTNYSRLQSDVDSITLPDTPFNSIVQVAKKLEVCAIDYNEDETIRDYHHRNTSSPVQIPKRVMKHDESAPILSGGASINDFVPKKSESPIVKRKTDSCPIVSGGSLDIAEEPQKYLKSVTDRERSSFSWVVDLKDNLKVDNIEENNEEDKKNELFPKTSSCATPKNSLGFYVDFNSLEAPVQEVTKPKTDNLRKQSLKKSTGFYVDLSSSDMSCPNTPNKQQILEETKKDERRASIESNDSKKNIFNMFVEFDKNELQKNDQVNADIEVSQEQKPSPPQTTAESTTSGKKGCFMFIENDSHIVKHRNRKMLAKESSIKRHSWNVNQTNEFEDIKTSAKVYQRSTSVSNDDEKIIPSSLPAIPSKTSSMSIGSSLSPHEDFSCSKSLSSRSNLTISTSNTSIENSETRVQYDDAGKKIVRKRRKEAKINETYDKSSQGSITDEIFSTGDVNTTTPSDTDTEDITFQNPKENDEIESEVIRKEQTSLLDEVKTKMDTIVETSENSSPFKKANVTAVNKNNNSDSNNSEMVKNEPPMHTMESLQQLIERQKQILETVTEPNTTATSLPFVKLSDLDKPPNKKEYSPVTMTNSAGFRVSLMDNQKNNHCSVPNENKNMSRSTGNNIANLASSVENSKSLSRLFPHLSKVFSSSVPSNVGFNINSTDQSLFEYIEFISSDFSCTSSINSSRSGMESADESSISCRQPRRLGEDLLKMFLQEIGTDITIDVNGKRIKAHKIILSSRCQYFAAMLAGKWVENNGNVINLSGYSYSVVHFALQHVYSGAAHVPCGLDLMELASLSDFLGLEGLKEVTGYALKTNYCHNFHKPCSGCIDGVLEIMPVSLDHGFDELYRKCLKWVCKHFCKVWTSKSFTALNYDMQIRCSQQIIAHFTSENVLYWILDCEEVLKSLQNSRWESFDLQNIVRVIMDEAQNYILDHFANLIASDCFLSLGHGRKDVILKLEHNILRAAASLSPDQACRSYPRAVRLNALLNAKLIKFPSPLSNESFKPFDRIQLRDEDEEIQWNDDFIKLVSALLSAVEQCLIRQCSRAIKCSAWQRMDADLRSKIQKIACVTESDDMRKTLRSSVTSLGSASVSSSAASRANDLRQVKLVIESNSNFSYDFKKYKSSNVKNNPVTHRDYIANSRMINNKSNIQSNRHSDQNNKTIIKTTKLGDKKPQNHTTETRNKFNFVKSKYMDPPKPRITLSDISSSSSQVKRGGRLSSSEASTRESSPAFSKKKTIEIIKKSSNLSLDSLQSPAKNKNNVNTNILKKDSEISMDSLTDSNKNSQKIDRASVESLLKKNYLNSRDNLRGSTRVRQSASQSSVDKPMVQKSFLSQKSREILSKKSQQARKLSTNSTNSSIATKSTKSSSPKMIPINKSHSTTAVTSNKKVFSTTLHLRKTSKLPEPIDVKNIITNNTKSQRKEIPSLKNVKENEKKKSEKIIKTTKLFVGKNNQQKDNASISPDTSKDESIENKMARSNTFSKETSDNPIELLKTMN